MNRGNLFPLIGELGVATALELLDSVCFCITLSTGQLPPQTVHPVSIATFLLPK